MPLSLRTLVYLLNGPHHPILEDYWEARFAKWAVPPEVLGAGMGRVPAISMAHGVPGHYCDGQGPGPGTGQPASAIVV